jgi:hypothetical protein
MNITDVPASASGPWPAPAKLNLLLHITGQRADGYHELQTLFQFLTFGDWLYFDLRSDADVQLSGEPAGVAAADDLTVQAAILLKESTGCSSGVSILQAAVWAAAARMPQPRWRYSTSSGSWGFLWMNWPGWACAWGRMCRCLFAGKRHGLRA